MKRPHAQKEIMPDTPGEAGAKGNPPNPPEIREFRIRKALKIEPFNISENPLEIGQAWKEWIENFEE